MKPSNSFLRTAGDGQEGRIAQERRTVGGGQEGRIVGFLIPLGRGGIPSPPRFRLPLRHIPSFSQMQPH